MESTGDLIRRAIRWCSGDPDPATRAELDAIITATQAGDDAALADLAGRFTGPLTFGTAGLRGEVGAGESRMNVAVVTRATAGVARYVLDTVGPGARVVVGCDARRGSAEFFAATTGVLAAAGLEVFALPAQLPTPLVAYAVRALDCAAGIMVTASHNPPADNGYKVYLGGPTLDPHARGVQIVPPADTAIADRIAAAPPAIEIRREVAPDTTPEASRIVDDYVDRTAALRTRSGPAAVRVVLTALHGVGGQVARQVLVRAGIDDVHVVAEQIDPDPGFPTVAFPNPEEPGVLDASISLARKVSADVVIALDPDADRCAVAIPGRDGGWRRLTGDELGALLGEQAAADHDRPGDTLACSIVSSRLLAHVAAAHGLRHRFTLTGFKWIARTPDLRFGYEEAIGYCTDPAAVADKDGISTMVRVVTLVEAARTAGRCLDDLLDDLARRHGLHATAPLSFRVSDPATIGTAMTRLRARGVSALAGSPVVEFRDLATGSADLPPTDGLLIRTADDARVIVRPSGTEPKLKCYLEVVLSCADDGRVPREAAAHRLRMLADDMTAVLGLT
ncbi:phospho-sugar mutase [Gordonia sp. ABSL1-1]|uniref:phospho-sugar mutase n=1 Tax=Gordonia sp. ABSL1-1 TaxID=3053923 RepID=UPI0025735868|nr:phospho-sugar mutase [Gordonia sp. ABSL1-1]MDL9935935.1 phospho-sugar mutase [Gordonia sp. ABSL1-1]